MNEIEKVKSAAQKWLNIHPDNHQDVTLVDLFNEIDRHPFGHRFLAQAAVMMAPAVDRIEDKSPISQGEVHE